MTPVFDPDAGQGDAITLPDDPEAEEVQRVVNAYLNALIRGTLEEQDEAGLRWDEMTKRKDLKNNG